MAYPHLACKRVCMYDCKIFIGSARYVLGEGSLGKQLFYPLTNGITLFARLGQIVRKREIKRKQALLHMAEIF